MMANRRPNAEYHWGFIQKNGLYRGKRGWHANCTMSLLPIFSSSRLPPFTKEFSS
jgi:hypothetical protein